MLHIGIRPQYFLVIQEISHAKGDFNNGAFGNVGLPKAGILNSLRLLYIYKPTYWLLIVLKAYLVAAASRRLLTLPIILLRMAN